MPRLVLISYSKLLLVFLGLQIFTETRAQNIDVRIEVDSKQQIAKVSGRFLAGFAPANPKNLVFKKTAPGQDRLAERIFDVSLGNVPNRRLMAGEYLAESRFDSWVYSVDLKPPRTPAALAHASWVGDQAGILYLDDVLPQFESGGRRVSGAIKFDLPSDWTSVVGNEFRADDVSRTVIMIGKGIVRSDASGKDGSLSIYLSGEFQFEHAAAAKIAREIFEEYSKTIGKLTNREYRIFLLKLPPSAGFGSWEAGTIGSTVTLVTGDATFASTALQRLHEQLRHEIFHLWMPNALNLTGDYSWFYEGFALYQSLKLGVGVNRIRFDDFLDTLSRAYTIDANAKPRLPLTSSAVDPTVRYARGMLVAFLMDLELLANSRGRSDVSSLLRALYKDHGVNAKPAAAEITLKSILKPVVMLDRNVFGAEPIVWTAELAAAGLVAKQTGSTTTLAVATKLSGRQKEILDRLGYNNWRKIGTKK